MIISISGPDSLEKSELINLLKKEMNNYLFQDEMYQLYYDEKDCINTEQKFIYQLNVIKYILKLSKTNIYYSRELPIIMNGCSFDSLIHIFLSYYKLDDNNKLKYAVDFLNGLIICIKLLQSIDRIYVILPEKNEDIQEINLFKNIHLNKICILPNNIDRMQTIINDLQKDGYK